MGSLNTQIKITMQAIILAGGFGTRLKSLVQDVPKPMAPMGDRPFLAWLLEYLESQGVDEAVLCLHHMPQRVQTYFGPRFGNIRLRYSIEEQPLGTGGAIRQGLSLLSPRGPVFALNGDSLVQVDYKSMMRRHIASGRKITIATRQVPDCSRYSELTIQGGSITHYETYGGAKPGHISTGFYILSPDIFFGAYLPGAGAPAFPGMAEEAFSFERDFLAPLAPELLPAAYDGVDYFIDIGIPQDYARAQEEIPRRIKIAA